MIKKVESSQNPEGPHVLTEKEAFELLLATDDYFSCISKDYVDGRHLTEAIARTMELHGLFDQVSDLMLIHDYMKKFADGDARSLQYFSETPAHENLTDKVNNTRFSKSVADAMKPIAEIEKILDYRDIDWEKSAEVIAMVKKERFPKMLTMVEKLSNWQRDQSPKGHSER